MKFDAEWDERRTHTKSARVDLAEWITALFIIENGMPELIIERKETSFQTGSTVCLNGDWPIRCLRELLNSAEAQKQTEAQP